MKVSSQRDISGADGVLQRQALELRRAGEWASLAELLDHLPASELTGNADLGLMRAEAAIRLGDPHHAVELTSLLIGEDGAVSPSLRAKALLIRSAASRMRGFPDKALEDAGTAMAIIESDASQVGLVIEGHKQLGILLGMVGQLDQSIEHLETAHRLCAKTADLELLGGVEANLGVAFTRLGRLSEARVHFTNARAAYRKLGHTAELAWTLDNIGRLLYDLGQHGASLSTLQLALQLARDAKARRTEAMVLVNIADTLQALGEHEEALESYQRALGCGEQALEPRLYCCANTGLGSVYLDRGDLKNARFYLTQASYEAERLKLKHELAVAVLHLGMASCAEGNQDQATKDLNRSIALLQQTGSPASLVKAYLHLSLVLLRRKKWARLKTTLVTLSGLVRDLDLRWNLVQEAKAVREVVDYAASKRIGGALFRVVRDDLEGKAKYALSGALPEHEVSQQEPRFPMVEVHSLGRFEVRVDGRTVSEAEWESQKAKELFLYLLCHREGKGQEELLEVLWPEVAVNLSRNAFYNNVYRTRRALFRECLLRGQGRYTVNPTGQFWFDLDEFRRLIAQAEGHSTDGEMRASLLSQAVKLYRGPFLRELYAEWANTVRMDAEADYLRSLARLARYHGARGDYEEALSLLERLLSVDNTDEGANEQLIKLLIRKGDIADAQRRYNLYRERLTTELGVQPTKQFAQLRREAMAAL